ncbi:hypothetical protein PIB30_035684 [Stylosanthes scabra]|uniref:Uncharacterized protein n=1 Tax=Stylosanthes scabra TaxID=79078 RepID=A0ABU6UDS3_9FABA|nr:hypothetical protein [Stylosanthes scabra]
MKEEGATTAPAEQGSVATTVKPGGKEYAKPPSPLQAITGRGEREGEEVERGRCSDLAVPMVEEVVCDKEEEGEEDGVGEVEREWEGIGGLGRGRGRSGGGGSLGRSGGVGGRARVKKKKWRVLVAVV